MCQKLDELSMGRRYELMGLKKKEKKMKKIYFAHMLNTSD